MAVAVSLGATSFDFTPLIKEQQRLGKQLLDPVPRLKSDPTQALVYREGPTGNTYQCYIEVTQPNSNAPGAQPTYELRYRDNTNIERNLGSVPVTVPPSTLGDALAPANGNITFDFDTGEIKVGGANVVAGVIQFQAASGLTLASVNRRLSDINSAIEAMSRVMQVASGASEGVQSLLR